MNFYNGKCLETQSPCSISVIRIQELHPPHDITLKIAALARNLDEELLSR